MIIALVGCDKSTDLSSEVTMQLEAAKQLQAAPTMTVVDYLQFYETNDQVDYHAVTFGLGARLYKIDKSNPQLNGFKALIKVGKKKGKPLKVTFDQATSELIHLNVASKPEIIQWESENPWFNNENEGEPLEDRDDIDLTNAKSALSVSFATYSDLVNAFTTLKQESCTYTFFSNNCIPFAYKADGCYARAHRMRYLLENIYGKTCYKMFVYADVPNGGGLNIPGCPNTWTYHVAPNVYCQSNSTWYVLDPSLDYSAPLTESAWVNLMGSSNVCKTEFTGERSYAPKSWGCASKSYHLDDSYSHTLQTLSNYKFLSGC